MNTREFPCGAKAHLTSIIPSLSVWLVFAVAIAGWEMTMNGFGAEPDPLPLQGPTITLVANPATITAGSMTKVTAYALHGNAKPAAGVLLSFGSSGAGDAGDFDRYPSAVTTDPDGRAVIGWIGGNTPGKATIAASAGIDGVAVSGETQVGIVYGTQPTLQNGAFEAWIGQVSPAYWANGNVVNVTRSTDAHTGTYSVKVETGAVISQMVKVAPGRDYQFSWWTKTTFAGPAIVGYAKTEWLDSSFSSIGAFPTTFITAFTNWTAYGPNTFIAPPTAAYVRIAFESTPGYDMLIDDAVWTPSGTTTVTIQPGPADGNDSSVRSCEPALNFGNDSELYVVDYESCTARTYLDFDLSVIPIDAVIVSADLELFYHLHDSDPNLHDVGVHAVGGSWDEGTITWNNQPAFDKVPEDVLPLPRLVSQGPYAFVRWDIKDLVQGWVSLLRPQQGVVVKATAELGRDARLMAAFPSSEWDNCSERPRLIVNYQRAPGLPDLIVKSLSQSPGTPPPQVGDSYVYFDIVLKNQGRTRAYLRNMKLSLYKNNLSNFVGEVLWSPLNTECLDPGQELTVKAITMPNSDLTKTAGTFTVIAYVDPGNVIAESDEGNNQLSKPITIAAANRAPNTPTTPSGPTSGTVGTSYSYSTSATDPDGDQAKYTFDWGDGQQTATGLVNSGTSASASHAWTAAGTYLVKAMATDSKGAGSGWSSSLSVVITNVNRAPNTPSIPSGPTSGNTGVSYSYSTSAADPDGDQVKYTFDWGDGQQTTTGLVNSGTSASASHAWAAAGTYLVKVRTTDSKGAVSGWSSSLTVVIAGATMDFPHYNSFVVEISRPVRGKAGWIFARENDNVIAGSTLVGSRLADIGNTAKDTLLSIADLGGVRDTGTSGARKLEIYTTTSDVVEWSLWYGPNFYSGEYASSGSPSTIDFPHYHSFVVEISRPIRGKAGWIFARENDNVIVGSTLVGSRLADISNTTKDTLLAIGDLGGVRDTGTSGARKLEIYTTTSDVVEWSLWYGPNGYSSGYASAGSPSTIDFPHYHSFTVEISRPVRGKAGWIFARENDNVIVGSTLVGGRLADIGNTTRDTLLSIADLGGVRDTGTFAAHKLEIYSTTSDVVEWSLWYGPNSYSSGFVGP
jgi:hypothetical protein